MMKKNQINDTCVTKIQGELDRMSLLTKLGFIFNSEFSKIHVSIP